MIDICMVFILASVTLINLLTLLTLVALLLGWLDKVPKVAVVFLWIVICFAALNLALLLRATSLGG